jgi:hypothetical protein
LGTKLLMASCPNSAKVPIDIARIAASWRAIEISEHRFRFSEPQPETGSALVGDFLDDRSQAIASSGVLETFP